MRDSKLCWVEETDKSQSQTSVAEASKPAVINTYTETVEVRLISKLYIKFDRSKKRNNNLSIK